VTCLRSGIQVAPGASPQRPPYYTLGVQAYLWGFPLRFYGDLIPGSLKAGGTYLNDFHKFTDLKTAKDRFIVTPNNVTIDSYCNFDVT
jgi:hypothetical protein